MALTLGSTDQDLNALIRKVFEDEKIDAHEHIKLRRISDDVLGKVEKLESLSNDIQSIARHADGFVEACTSLAKQVFIANINLQKRIKAQQLAELEVSEPLTEGVAAETKEDINATIVSLGEELIRAIEYQVAYIVIGTQQTAPKMRKDAVKIV